MVKVVIIGAGISGSSTAYLLKKSHPSVDVTIIAKSYSPNTTSDGAAGLWEPYLAAKTPENIVKRWSKMTYGEMMSHTINNPESSLMGISTCYGYHLNNKETFETPFWADIPCHYHKLTKRELERFPSYVKSGFAYLTLFFEGSKLVPWYTKKFVELGGKLIQKEITSLSEVAGSCDVIVNCSGLGARELVLDKELVPIRGQILRVRAPWLREFVIYEDGEHAGYILPNQNWVVLGGTAESNQEDLTPSLKDKERILKMTKELAPSLQFAEPLIDWVGLRPSRSTMRNEKEEMKISDKDGNIISVKVVHNYGHGGSGMTVHWGCAVDAVGHVTDYLDYLRQLRDGALTSSKL